MVVNYDDWHSMNDETPMDGDLCLLCLDDGEMIAGGWGERERHFYLNCGWGGGLTIDLEAVTLWTKINAFRIIGEEDESKL